MSAPPIANPCRVDTDFYCSSLFAGARSSRCALPSLRQCQTCFLRALSSLTCLQSISITLVCDECLKTEHPELCRHKMSSVISAPTVPMPTQTRTPLTCVLRLRRCRAGCRAQRLRSSGVYARFLSTSIHRPCCFTRCSICLRNLLAEDPAMMCAATRALWELCRFKANLSRVACAASVKLSESQPMDLTRHTDRTTLRPS